MRNSVIAAVALCSALTAGKAAADATYQPLPFGQDWTNTGLITLNDDWSGVPGIIGYLGDNPLSTTTARVPCTIVGDSTTAVDVIANLVNPNTTTNGGVGEFDALANPTIALQGSGTADFPNIQIHLDTRCYTDIIVRGNLRDIDGSADNAVQGIAIQYRVGTTGVWTNLQCFSDVTTGPSLATAVTPFSAALPVGAENQAQVQVRVLTTNAASNDEWVGVDDLSVNGTTCAVPAISTTWSGVKARTE
jgi:uncharacterized protein